MKKTIALSVLLLIVTLGHASTVTGFNGTYRNGQVFFTWNVVAGNNPLYKLYRSSNPITQGSQLASCEYLGYTDKNSSLNWNLTTHDGVNKYWIIQDGGDPLTAQQGLFVTTTLSNGSYYYALTVTLSTEDTEIIVGSNSLSSPITETVSTPDPVLQEIRTINNKPIEIYGDFMSSKIKPNGPLRMKAGWLGYDFAIYRNNATSPQGLHIRFHAGGADFLTNIEKVYSTELNLGVSDWLPSDESTGWIGSHPNYDPFKPSNNSPPVSGTDYFYTQTRLLQTLDWVIDHFPVDSNKVWVDGTSYGATGAFVFALLNPSRIAAADITCGVFDFGFQNDYNPECSMNTGEKNRVEGDEKLGTLTTNLSEECGIPVYDLLNGGKMIHDFNDRDYPVFCSTNGRNDDLLGWSEKPIWYDSVNNNHIGGYYFFDKRDHAGDGKRWAGDNFSMYRYAKNVSYPAFSNCSLDGNPGNGNGSNGDSVGSINGYLDWKEKSSDLTDKSTTWKIKIFLRDLKWINNVVKVAPNSCIVDVTPRRLQKFNPPAGSSIEWNVKHLNQQVQSGSFTYTGGAITIPDVEVFKDTITLEINYTESFATITPSEDFSACNSAKVTFTTNSGSGFTYQWYRNNTVISNATSNKYNSKGTEEGTYKVKVTNSLGDAAFSPSITLTRIANPKAVIDPLGNLNICNTGSVQLKAKDGTGTEWQWYKNGVVKSGATNQTYTATTNGDYTVLVTNPEGCTKLSSKVVVYTSCRDAENFLLNNVFSIEHFPNPAQDYLQIRIQYQEVLSGLGSLEILDMMGKIILDEKIEFEGIEFFHTIDLSGLTPGTYVVKYHFNDQLRYAYFIKS